MEYSGLISLLISILALAMGVHSVVQGCTPDSVDGCLTDVKTALDAGITNTAAFCPVYKKIELTKTCVWNAISSCNNNIIKEKNTTLQEYMDSLSRNEQFCHPGCGDWFSRLIKMNQCQAFGGGTASNPCGGPRQAAACSWRQVKGCPYLIEQLLRIMGSSLTYVNNKYDCNIEFPGVVLPTPLPTAPPPGCDINEWNNCTSELKTALKAGPTLTTVVCPVLIKYKGIQMCAHQATGGCNKTVLLQYGNDLAKDVSVLREMDKYCDPGCDSWFDRFLHLQDCVNRYANVNAATNPCGGVRQAAFCAWSRVQGCPYLHEEFIRVLGYSIVHKNKDHDCQIKIPGLRLPTLPQSDCAGILQTCDLFNETQDILSNQTVSKEQVAIICSRKACVMAKIHQCENQDIQMIGKLLSACDQHSVKPTTTQSGVISSGNLMGASFYTVTMECVLLLLFYVKRFDQHNK